MNCDVTRAPCDGAGLLQQRNHLLGSIARMNTQLDAACWQMHRTRHAIRVVGCLLAAALIGLAIWWNLWWVAVVAFEAVALASLGVRLLDVMRRAHEIAGWIERARAHLKDLNEHLRLA